MSYDYERYDGKRIVVDGEVIGLLAMEFGHEVEEVYEEYHAELAMTEWQERQSEAYKESLRRTLSAQYEKVATLEAENAKLRELCAGLLTGYECGYGELCKGCTWDGIGDSKTFSCLPRAKARELGVEVEEDE